MLNEIITQQKILNHEKIVSNIRIVIGGGV